MMATEKLKVNEKDLAALVGGYIEAALFTGTDDDDRPLDDEYDRGSIADDSVRAIQGDCRSFLYRVEQTGMEWWNDGGDARRLGIDFFLTRGGHGAGFWDGDWPECGDRLTEIAKGYGDENYLYVGDDGLLHVPNEGE